MSRRDVVRVLDEAGVPVAHAAFPVGKAPDLPWIVFMLDADSQLAADNGRYSAFPTWRAELYQRTADAALERALERAIERAFGGYVKYEAWVDEENCLLTSYTFTEVPKEEQ